MHDDTCFFSFKLVCLNQGCQKSGRKVLILGLSWSTCHVWCMLDWSHKQGPGCMLHLVPVPATLGSVPCSLAALGCILHIVPDPASWGPALHVMSSDSTWCLPWVDHTECGTYSVCSGLLLHVAITPGDLRPVLYTLWATERQLELVPFVVDLVGRGKGWREFHGPDLACGLAPLIIHLVPGAR